MVSNEESSTVRTFSPMGNAEQISSLSFPDFLLSFFEHSLSVQDRARWSVFCMKSHCVATILRQDRNTYCITFHHSTGTNPRSYSPVKAFADTLDALHKLFCLLLCMLIESAQFRLARVSFDPAKTFQAYRMQKRRLWHERSLTEETVYEEPIINRRIVAWFNGV